MAVSFGAQGQGFTGNPMESHIRQLAAQAAFQQMGSVPQAMPQGQPQSFLEQDVARAAMLSQLGAMQDANRQAGAMGAAGTRVAQSQAQQEQIRTSAMRDQANLGHMQSNAAADQLAALRIPGPRGQGSATINGEDMQYGGTDPYAGVTDLDRQQRIQAAIGMMPGGAPQMAPTGYAPSGPSTPVTGPGPTAPDQQGQALLQQLGERLGNMLRPPPDLMQKFNALVAAARTTGTVPVEAVAQTLAEAESTQSLGTRALAGAREQAGAATDLATLFTADPRVAKSFEDAILNIAAATSAAEEASSERLRTRKTPGEFFLGSSTRGRNRRIVETRKAADTAGTQRDRAIRSLNALLEQYGVNAQSDPRARVIIDNAMIRASNAVRAGQPVESVRQIAQDAIMRLQAAQSEPFPQTAAGE